MRFASRQNVLTGDLFGSERCDCGDPPDSCRNDYTAEVFREVPTFRNSSVTQYRRTRRRQRHYV